VASKQCKRSKINFKDHNMPLTCGNVELRGFEPRTSCMPYKSSQWHDMAGCGSTSSFNRSTSPAIAHYCLSLAPRLAPQRLLATVSPTPHGTVWRPMHRVLTIVGDVRAGIAGSAMPGGARAAAMICGCPATVAASPRTWAAGRADPRVSAALRTAGPRWRIQGCSDYRTCR
jgi:hypothetical protein